MAALTNDIKPLSDFPHHIEKLKQLKEFAHGKFKILPRTKATERYWARNRQGEQHQDSSDDDVETDKHGFRKHEQKLANFRSKWKQYKWVIGPSLRHNYNDIVKYGGEYFFPTGKLLDEIESEIKEYEKKRKTKAKAKIELLRQKSAERAQLAMDGATKESETVGKTKPDILERMENMEKAMEAMSAQMEKQTAMMEKMMRQLEIQGRGIAHLINPELYESRTHEK